MTPRPYLRPAERRRQLLEATERVLARDGAARITMRAIAAEAGVSRQLLYNHFPDLASVIEAYAREALGGLLESGGVGVSSPGSDPVADGAATLDVVLSMRPDQRQMIRLVHARALVEGLERLTTVLESRFFERWRGYDAFASIPDGALRTALWMMSGVVLDLAEGVERGDISRADADATIRRLAATFPPAFGATPRDTAS